MRLKAVFALEEWGDWICDKPWSKDWMYLEDWDWLQKFLCLFWGHYVIADHCGMPEHDYCRGCGQLMPGKAKRG